MSYKSISVDVDIDIDEVLGEASTAELLAELSNRNEPIFSSLTACIERLSGRIISSFTDEELAEWVIKQVRR